MKKTLQDQYLLIKEGKGHKDVFIKEAKQQFPGLIRNSATYTEVANVLKTKNIINENVVGIGPINNITPSKKESYEVAFEKFLAEAKKEYFDDEKAELKKPSKQVEEDAEKNFDREDMKNPDNLIFDQIMKGYYTEMKDPKNEDKTVEELKAIVFKNLEKNPIYYTEKGQFGVKDLGYTTEAPGLGEPKEPKGPHKSSGYGTLKESKEPVNEEIQIRKVVRSIINEELEEGYNSLLEFKRGETVMYMGEKHKVDFSDGSIVKLERSNGDIVTLNKSQADEKVRYQKDFSESLNESKIRKVIRESVEKELAEINKEAEYEVYESKLEKIAELIERKSARLSRLDEDEDLKALTDKKKVKELQRDIKKLEKAFAKIEKALAKKAKKGKATPKKKEVIDEDEPISEVASEDAEAAAAASGEAADELERAAAAAKELDDALEEDIEAPADYIEAKDDAESRYDAGEELESILSDYPKYRETLERDILGKFDGMDY